MKVGLKEKKYCKKINGSMLSFYIVDEIQFFFVQTCLNTLYLQKVSIRGLPASSLIAIKPKF